MSGSTAMKRTDSRWVLATYALVSIGLVVVNPFASHWHGIVSANHMWSSAAHAMPFPSESREPTNVLTSKTVHSALCTAMLPG